MFEFPKRVEIQTHFSRRSVVAVLARPVFLGLDLCMLSHQR